MLHITLQSIMMYQVIPKFLGPLKGQRNPIMPRWHVMHMCSETSFRSMHDNGGHDG